VPSPATEERLTQYLLGELSDSDSSDLEKEYFDDDAAFEQLMAVEEELMDEYVRGGLSPDRRERLEKRLQLTQQDSRVKFARALSHWVRSAVARERRTQDARSPPWWVAIAEAFRARWLAVPGAAGLILAVVGGFLLFTQLGRLRNELRQMGLQQLALEQREQALQRDLQTERERNAEMRQQLESQARVAEEKSTPQEAAPPKTASFLLLASVRDARAGNRLAIKPDLESVLLQVRAEDGRYRGYQASLQTVDGKSVLRGSPMSPIQAPSGRLLSLKVAGRRLPPGGYILSVNGLNADGTSVALGEYYFQVVK
jgi:hypothetical protein